ncbi:MFS transporter [Cellulomonas fimi]|uniref:MFS transporter n=1 Tax=Cellulomonas fimi TaxID=1708 RepID=A0A7Y0QH27_CELFI|nr:MFS transporter [Cellulomonas fimi]NMR19743.1 MFS transporter [Cellulomonas fimi]
MTTLENRTAARGTRAPVWLLVLGVVLTAANLRPAIAAVGPLLDRIEQDRGLSTVDVVVLTSGPVLLFGLVAPLAAVLVRRWGVARAQAVALGVLGLGQLARALPEVPALLGGTLAAGAGIAVLNVVLPAVVKQYFPHRAGLMTGVYTTSVNIAAAVAAAVAVPLGASIGWEGSLAVWSAPAILAAALWLFVRASPVRQVALGAPGGRFRLVRDPLAWQVAGYLGLQSLLWYTSVAWLAQIHQDAGLSGEQAGALLGLLLLVGIPFALVVPPAAARAPHQRWYVVGLAASGMAGIVGLLVAPSAAPLVWTVLIGIAIGGSFPLAMTMVVLRSGSVAQAAALSAMAQTIGYVVAASGPLLAGWLREATGSWTTPLVLLLVTSLGQVALGLAAGRPRLLGGAQAPV